MLNIDPSTAYSTFDWDHLAKFCQVENLGESIWSEYVVLISVLSVRKQ